MGKLDSYETINGVPHLKVAAAVASSDTSPESFTATIADGQSLSAAVDLGGRKLVGLATPAGWTTAVITFQWSPDDVTYYEYDDALGIAVELPSIAASKSRAIDPADFAGVRYLKVRSGTVGSPTVQAGSDAVTLMAIQV